jgi:2-methylcitrate dehydratase PrpD
VNTRDDTITGGRRVTRELAEWVAAVQYDALPEPVASEAASALADFLGECLFVGATKPWGRTIAEFCARDGGGQPEATIIANGAKTLASRAALANGTMALGFEYADYGAGSRPYPFAVTGPLALAEAHHRTGRELALAIVVGYEVMWRVFRATMRKGVSIPLYVPALYGTIGCAAACARLLELPVEQTNFAIGLAAGFTGGTFQGHEEGAWQRTLNGGMASERGVTCALFAATGFRATEMGLEGVQGFAKMFTEGHLDADALLDELPAGRAGSFIITNRWVKRYPMNTTLHAPVEALLAVMREHELTSSDILEIDAGWQRVEPFLAKHDVATVVSAQASLPFALAVAAVRGKVGVDEFTDETVADPSVRAMIDRTVVHQDTELYEKVPGGMPGRVTVRTKDGRELTAEVLHPKGSPGNRMTEAEFKFKFIDMAARVLGPEQAETLYVRARALPDIDDVAELAPLFSPFERT